MNFDVSKCFACGLRISKCLEKIPHMHPKENHILICDLCDGNPKCVEACQEEKWNTLKVTSRIEGISYEAFAKTPEILTIEYQRSYWVRRWLGGFGLMRGYHMLIQFKLETTSLTSIEEYGSGEA